MLKKLFIGGLVLIVAVAIGASAYNVYAQRNVDTHKTALTSDYTETPVEQSSEHSFGKRGESDWNQIGIRPQTRHFIMMYPHI